MEGGSYYRKGLWTEEEDKILIDYIREHGKGRWSRVSKITGLKRCGKSCRLRWMNYLSPHVKKGEFSEEEEDLIIRLHKLLGNRWSLIAGRVPGRTDNQVKNYWNTHLSKKLGIKKAKKKASTSSLIVTQECKQEIGHLNQPTSSQTELPISDDNSRAIGSIESKDASQAVAASTAPQEPKMSECVGSVLFANDSANLSTPSLMEIFESYSLDMFWNGF